MAEKQINQVYDAIKSGCETAAEVEAVTDINRAAVSAYLSELREAGLIVHTHLPKRKLGQPFARYRVATGVRP